MTTTTDFIAVYENAFSHEFCRDTIAYFEEMQKLGYTKDRQVADKVSKLIKDDEALFAHEPDVFKLNGCPQLMQHFTDKLWNDLYLRYQEEHPILSLDFHGINSYYFKIQKTKIGQGYHTWHAEGSKRETSNRIAVWTLYLNDIEEGGETEFLYQHRRIKAKEGTFCIFPSSFTHVHRGNPPISNDKYIMTGWIEF